VSIVSTGAGAIVGGPVGAAASLIPVHITFKQSSATTAGAPVDQLVAMLDQGNLGAFAILQGFVTYHGGVVAEKAVWQAGLTKMLAAHPTAKTEALAAYTEQGFAAAQAYMPGIANAPAWASANAKPASWASSAGGAASIGQIPPAPAPSVQESLLGVAEDALSAAATSVGARTGAAAAVTQAGQSAAQALIIKVVGIAALLGLVVGAVYFAATAHRGKKAA
jgi:hypothetical protein